MKILTHSAMQAFRACPAKFYNRYCLELVPPVADEALQLGSLFHAGVAAHESGGVWELPNSEVLWDVETLICRAIALVDGYKAKYSERPWESVAVEKIIGGQIVNPDTGATSRSFEFKGRVDQIVKATAAIEPFEAQDVGKLFLVERKTTSMEPTEFLERLWTDSQIHIYALYLRRMGLPIAGIVYDTAQKATIKRGEEEPEEDFAARYAALCATNKSGKSTAKRKLAEPANEWLARLCEWQTPDKYNRAKIYIDDARLDAMEWELWETTQRLLSCSAREAKVGRWAWSQHTGHCFHYNRACEYYPLCSSGYAPWELERLEKRPPNEELNGEGN